MSVDVAIDIETTGTRPGCCILSIGAIVFDRGQEIGHAVDGFYDVLDYDISRMLGFHEDPDTMNWWDKQSRAARESVFQSGANASQPRAVLEELTVFLKYWKVKYMWVMGQDFDIPILRAYYDEFELKWPIHFTMGRDIRTYCQAAKVDRYRLKDKSMTSHRADHDAHWAAKCVQAAYEKLQYV